MLHVYHGDGKGKTTAAMGLALRCAGVGNEVCIVQCLKGAPTGELKSLKCVPHINIYRNLKDYGFYNNMSEEDKNEVLRMHNESLKKAVKEIKNGHCQLLIMDELLSTYQYGLIDCELVRKLIIDNKDTMEIVVTGRNPDSFFLKQADYITEMKKIKHPYDKGIKARKGIEF